MEIISCNASNEHFIINEKHLKKDGSCSHEELQSLSVQMVLIVCSGYGWSVVVSGLTCGRGCPVTRQVSSSVSPSRMV